MGIRQTWRSLLLALTALLLGLSAATESVARHFRIPSQAMAPTMRPGETIWTSPIESANVRVGDIVVYDVVDGNRVIAFVKRVLALPGQRIAFRDGVPIVDGQPLTRTDLGPEDVAFEGFGEGYFLHLRRYRETAGSAQYEIYYQDEPPLAPDATWSQRRSRDALLSSPLRQMDEIVVPAGQFFAVGDYRDNSNDSRSMGPVPLSAIHYRVEFIVFSGDAQRVGLRLRQDGQ